MTDLRTFVCLVTGSRSWTDKELLWGALDSLASGAKEAGYERFLVRHGACYPKLARGSRPARSADFLAHLWAAQTYRHPIGMPVTEDEMPANWAKFPRQAGFIRNQDMVDRGAAVCLSANLGTPGTTHCTQAAEAAGIPVMPLVPRGAA